MRDERFCSGALDDDAVCGHADLAGVGERALGDAPSGEGCVGVGEDDGGVLTAQFEHALFEVLCAGGGDDFADAVAACELYTLYI